MREVIPTAIAGVYCAEDINWVLMPLERGRDMKVNEGEYGKKYRGDGEWQVMKRITTFLPFLVTLHFGALTLTVLTHGVKRVELIRHAAGCERRGMPGAPFPRDQAVGWNLD